jgi:hypothetical protein
MGKDSEVLAKALSTYVQVVKSSINNDDKLLDCVLAHEGYQKLGGEYGNAWVLGINYDEAFNEKGCWIGDEDKQKLVVKSKVLQTSSLSDREKLELDAVHHAAMKKMASSNLQVDGERLLMSLMGAMAKQPKRRGLFSKPIGFKDKITKAIEGNHFVRSVAITKAIMLEQESEPSLSTPKGEELSTFSGPSLLMQVANEALKPCLCEAERPYRKLADLAYRAFRGNEQTEVLSFVLALIKAKGSAEALAGRKAAMQYLLSNNIDGVSRSTVNAMKACCKSLSVVPAISSNKLRNGLFARPSVRSSVRPSLKREAACSALPTIR